LGILKKIKKNGAVGWSTVSVSFYQITQHHIPEHSICLSGSCDSLISNFFQVLPLSLWEILGNT